MNCFMPPRTEESIFFGIKLKSKHAKYWGDSDSCLNVEVEDVSENKCGSASFSPVELLLKPEPTHIYFYRTPLYLVVAGYQSFPAPS